MSKMNDDENSNGIKMDAPPQDGITLQDNYRLVTDRVRKLEEDNHQKDERILQLTAMCYTLARRLRNESFSDNITAVQRQQMAEMAMQSLNMTPAVWELIHKSEEAQQQNSS